MSNFSIMILAAGYGTRMKNLTKAIPKPLLKLNNTTLLTNTINFFEKLGCEKFVINTHYLKDEIIEYINIHHPKQNIVCIYEPEILDTGGGIKNSIKYFNNKNFLVTNSDIYWNKNNIKDIKKIIDQIDLIKYCGLLLSELNNTNGINKNKGDFFIENNYLRRWKQNDPIIFYAGLQILNPIIFQEYNKKKFSINDIWDILIKRNVLEGIIMKSKLFHIGDIVTYKKFSADKTLD